MSVLPRKEAVFEVIQDHDAKGGQLCIISVPGELRDRDWSGRFGKVQKEVLEIPITHSILLNLGTAYAFPAGIQIWGDYRPTNLTHLGRKKVSFPVSVSIMSTATIPSMFGQRGKYPLTQHRCRFRCTEDFPTQSA